MPVQSVLELRSGSREWARRLASPRWTVLFFVLFAAASLAVARGLGSATAFMLVPFGLLLVNLVAGIVALPRFRADIPLLLFHLALLALVALLALARLIYFDGTTALSRGAIFDGTLLTDSRGPLHRGTLESLRFSNEGFTENQFRRGKYRATYNRIGWVDERGIPRLAEIGGDTPLVLGGYRIYTTGFRGFSPVFEWQPDDGAAAQTGAVQLSHAGNDTFGQKAEWLLPNGEAVWVMLDFTAVEDDARIRPSTAAAAELPHTLVLRIGDTRHVLQPGEHIERLGGRLRYVQLDSWMGYRIIHDPTEPWIIATVAVGILSMLWFYARRLRTRLPLEASP